jgi:hypothetical protein
MRERAWQVLAAVISVPIIFSAARGIRRGYLPIGDNALIEMRGRDVFTSHHPWLGTWSSASLSAGVDLNHPGPLIFDVVALPVKVFGGGPGIAIAVALLHVAVIWSIGWCANRFGGPEVAVVTMAFTAALVWSLGSEMLYDPWQPNVLILPFLLLLILVWGILAGAHGMLAWAVVVASFCVQTHLSYVFIAPGLVALAFGVVLWRAWARPSEVSARVRFRPVWWALAAGFLAWSQPLVEQFFGPGQGNLSRLVTADSSGEGTRTGIGLGLRLVGAVVALPPWFGRRGFVESIPITQWTTTPAGQEMQVPGLPGLGLVLPALGVMVLALGAAWWWGRINNDEVIKSSALLVGVVTSIATVTVIITPIDRLGLSPHKIRWLWPLAAFVAMVLTLAALRALRRSSDQWVLGALAAVAAGFALLTLPFHAQDSGPVAYREEMPRVRNLVAQLDSLIGRGTVLFDAGGLRFAEPFTAPVMSAMQQRGIHFVLDEEGLVRQMGEGRRYEGHADVLVYVREGPEALIVPPGAERVAFDAGLPPEAQAELSGLFEELTKSLTEGAWESLAASVGDDVGVGELAERAWRGEVDLEPLLGDRAERYIDLQRRWDGWGVAVFATPLTASVQDVGAP